MSYRQSPLGVRNHSRRPPLGPVVAVVAAIVAAALVAVFVWPGGSHHSAGGTTGSGGSKSPTSSPEAAAKSFAAAWSKGDLSGLDYTGGLTGTAVQTAYQTISKGLQARSVSVAAGSPTSVAGNDNAAQSALTVSWQLAGDQVWKYQTSVELDLTDGRWLVHWTPSVVQPSLGDGDTLRYKRLAAKRSTILDGAGQPLITDRPVVDVGVVPGKVADPVATATQLAAILHVDGAGLAARIKAAPADQFVDVITLRQPDFDAVAAKVTPIAGVVLHKFSEQLSPSHDFARSLLGTVGPVTKEIVDASKGRYVVGDIGGLSGLEKEYDSLIGGTPGYEIDVVHPADQGSAAPGSPGPGGTASATAVAVQQPVDGKPLQTTLDQRVQAAADAALGTVTGQPSALVAVRVSTGQVVAVANGPAGGGFDAALLGQIAPGSAFKVVTTTALLERGFDVNTTVDCPPAITVQGKSFHNYEGEHLGPTPFPVDFAQSCNTAFISLAPKVSGTALPDAARSLGIGACWSLGTAAFHGSVQAPKTPVDLAATAFGQGNTLVSPVSLAVAAATVARGSYLAPQLVSNGRPAGCGAASTSGTGSSSAPASAPASSASASPGSSAPLPPNVVSSLHSLMRQVVTSGTGTVLAGAPGGPVMAKTGTAEYGPGNPPKTHAWMIGFQGDIAFAVYVQDGKSGGTVAGPVALSFLQHLANG